MGPWHTLGPRHTLSAHTRHHNLEFLLCSRNTRLPLSLVAASTLPPEVAPPPPRDAPPPPPRLTPPPPQPPPPTAPLSSLPTPPRRAPPPPDSLPGPKPHAHVANRSQEALKAARLAAAPSAATDLPDYLKHCTKKQQKAYTDLVASERGLKNELEDLRYKVCVRERQRQTERERERPALLGVLTFPLNLHP